jgi:hypothetical protein
MSARSVHVLLALAAGAALGLGLRVAVSALDDSTLYVTATAAALALSAWLWWIARRGAAATDVAPEANPARGRAIAAFGTGAAALWLLLDAFTPGVPPLPGAQRAALSAADLRDGKVIPLSSAWDGSGHAAMFALSSAHEDTRAFGVLLRDGVPAAPYLEPDSAELTALCEQGLPSLAYARPHKRVLIAGGASNFDIACARHFSAQSIDVVEPSAALRALAPHIFDAAHDASGPRSRWYHANPRSFARAHVHRYDLVVLPALLDSAHTWPAGVLPVREATLETDAGLAALLDTLVPEGALFASVNGEPAALRFVVTVRAALLRLGVAHPELHIVVHQSGDAYGVLVKRAQFVLDEVLDLHQQNRMRKPLAELPWSDSLLRGAEQSPVLRSTPGAPFMNRFGQLLAPAPNAASVFAEHYLFDVSAPNDTRPLFYETSRIDQPQSLSVHSASRVLPALVLIVLLVVLVLAAAAGSSLAPSVASRLRAVAAPIATGCAQALAYACVQHALGLSLVPSQAFACVALGATIGAWFAFHVSGVPLSGRSRALLMARLQALAIFVAIAVGFHLAMQRVDVAAPLLLILFTPFVLGSALARPSAVALRAGATAPAWLAFAHAAGFALALPLAAAIVLFASYQALAIGTAALLALLALAALRRPA